MLESLTYLALVLVFAIALIASARLAPGSPTLLGGLFPPPAVRDWPIGVQEPDAPRFAVASLDPPRPGVGSAHAADEFDGPEIVELYERPWDPKTRLSRPA